MWYALTDKGTGHLVSLGTVLPDDAANRFDVYPLGNERPDLAAVLWDEDTRAFKPRPAPVMFDRADEMRAKLQAAFQADAQFMTVYNTLTTARKTALRQAMDNVLSEQFRAILGAFRWRQQGEPEGID